MEQTTNKNKAKNVVNKALWEMGKVYHDGLPLQEVLDTLHNAGFTETEEVLGVYCGREGRATAFVGMGTYLSFSWFKMPSGRFEVTAYVS
jgi:hypothetical protein